MNSVRGSVAVCGLIVAALALSCADAPQPAPALPQQTASPPSTLSTPERPPEPDVDVAGAIPAAVAREASPADRSEAEQRELVALYNAQTNAPLWLDRTGRMSGDSQEALNLLLRAGDEGLDPDDYGAGSLEQTARLLGDTGTRAASDLAAFDVGLSLGMLRYLRHLHVGRVDPRALGFAVAPRADEHDFPAVLRQAVLEHRLIQTVDSLIPPLTLYRNLRAGLATYRDLSENAAIVTPPLTQASVRPGDAYEGLVELHRLLVALGDVPADTPAPAGRYEGPVVEGVKHFQARHGLGPDGVLGRGTQQALQVPLSRRAQQMRLSLERLRWLPHIGDGPLIAVNIPMFRMWTWDSVPASPIPGSTMGVIVGQALKNQTPVFIQDMRSIVFRPYWNVPASITKAEILPALRRDAGYLDRQNMEIVSGGGDSATARPLTPETLAALERGALRVRQRPGPRNALGLVKFVFPNDENIYMHGTPAPELFARSRRDFSHGCIRLEDPVALAEWALRDQPAWTRDRIVKAMQGTETRTVTLSTQVQVVLFYMTAVVTPDTGAIVFAEDIYRHDAALEQALER